MEQFCFECFIVRDFCKKNFGAEYHRCCGAAARYEEVVQNLLAQKKIGTGREGIQSLRPSLTYISKDVLDTCESFAGGGDQGFVYGRSGSGVQGRN
jgi:hypothetical protein